MPISKPPSMAPGSDPIPPSTAAVNAFDPDDEALEEVDHAVNEPGTSSRPPRPTPPPWTKVSEIVPVDVSPRSKDAISLSCSQLRCCRPKEVREIISVNTVIKVTVNTRITIWM